jgi:hypothetical protein
MTNKMTHCFEQFRSRRFFLATASALALIPVGCGGNSENPSQPKENTKPFKMGERAAVGVLTYNILESTYTSQLGESTNPRIPDNRFLVMRVSVTNGGGKDIDIPLFTLVDEKGQKYQELQNGDGVKSWFGIIRKVAPTMTEEGRIVFDVKPQNYRLIITDGAETGQELIASIEVPMDFDTAEPILDKSGTKAEEKK